MSKDDIMHSSRKFLLGIYRNYVKRACENLGVPSNKNDEETKNSNENGYPSVFRKLDQKERKEAISEFSSTEDFMSMFSGTGKYNPKIFEKPEELKEV